MRGVIAHALRESKIPVLLESKSAKTVHKKATVFSPMKMKMRGNKTPKNGHFGGFANKKLSVGRNCERRAAL